MLGNLLDYASCKSLKKIIFLFKNVERFINLRSSLPRDHANLLWIVLVLVYVLLKETQI